MDRHRLVPAVVFAGILALAGCSDSSGNNELAAPTPTPATGSTLLGLDVDADGVRDDVEIKILERYPSSEPLRNSLRQLAGSIQSAFARFEGNDLQGINQAMGEIVRGVNCIGARSQRIGADVHFVENAVVDTAERDEAYTELNESVSGQFFGGSDILEESCND